MKILVTGGCGFIGSHITDLLIKNNHQVLTIDNLSTGSLKNLNPNTQFYKGDILDKNLSSLFVSEKPEIVFHLAAQVDLRDSIKNPFFDASQNILATINLLECCRKFDVKKIIYSSSGGSRFSTVSAKENSKIELESPYAISKYTVEHYLNFYKETYGIDFISLGYSNVYGPKQGIKGEAGVVSIFIKRMLEKQPPIIFGDGNQTRDFIFVDDVAEANLLALNKTKSSYLNISTGKETSINQLYFLIKNLLNFNGHPIFEPAVKGEKRRSSLDNTQAKNELHWQPKIDIKEGIKKTIEFFKK